jgi:hypothetical protein
MLHYLASSLAFLVLPLLVRQTRTRRRRLQVKAIQERLADVPADLHELRVGIMLPRTRPEIRPKERRLQCEDVVDAEFSPEADAGGAFLAGLYAKPRLGLESYRDELKEKSGQSLLRTRGNTRVRSGLSSS